MIIFSLKWNLASFRRPVSEVNQRLLRYKNRPSAKKIYYLSSKVVKYERVRTFGFKSPDNLTWGFKMTWRKNVLRNNYRVTQISSDVSDDVANNGGELLVTGRLIKQMSFNSTFLTQDNVKFSHGTMNLHWWLEIELDRVLEKIIRYTFTKSLAKVFFGWNCWICTW
jgi:hypothetical protein